MTETNINLIKSLPRKAFFLLAEYCKENVRNFREVQDSFCSSSYIKGIAIGRSGEKYTISLYSNMMVVEWGINSVTFDDDESKAVEKLYNEIAKNIPDSATIEKETIEELIKEFC